MLLLVDHSNAWNIFDLRLFYRPVSKQDLAGRKVHLKANMFGSVDVDFPLGKLKSTVIRPCVIY
jgi:hypothetical protein